MSRDAHRFEPVEGRPLAPLAPFRLEDRLVEVLVPGEAETWVVIPALDEAPAIPASLAALEAQTTRPLVVCIVDNGSSDGTPGIARAWAARVSAGGGGAGGFGVCLVHEPDRGTGAAADTGMRLAIANGARWLLRTDADSLPRPDWSARLVHRLASGADLVAGRVIERADERIPWHTRLLLVSLATVAGAISVPKNRGPDYRTRFRMLIGSSMGIRASTYVAAGGFPRSRIDEVHDDRALMNRARRVTDRIVSDRRAVVATSARRYRAYGLRGVIDWYLHHESRGAPVDVR